MSEIKTDKLTGTSTAGDITVTSEGGLATMQLQQGLAKVWSHYSGTGTTFNISFNLSSASDNGSGSYSGNFTSTLSSEYYSATDGTVATGTARGTFLCGSSYSHTTSGYTHLYRLSRGSRENGTIGGDADEVQVTIHGALA